MRRKKKPIVIFGAADIAQVAHFYMTHDSDYEIAAFTVDRDFLDSEAYCGLPLVPFEDVEAQYPSAEYDMFIAVSYTKLNAVRALKYRQAKAKGYHLISYINSRATTWPDLTIGDNCFIFEDNTIQPFVKIGNNVTLWSGNHIGHHSEIGDNCFIASHVVVSGGVKIEENCFIGVNATLRDHITIAKNCVIGAGTLILDSTNENEVYVGERARLLDLPSSKLKKL